MPHRMGLCITIRRPRYGYLAITFPRLEYLTLGQWPCGVNACPACKLQRTPPPPFFSLRPLPEVETPRRLVSHDEYAAEHIGHVGLRLIPWPVLII